jgi:hypothetical protein
LFSRLRALSASASDDQGNGREPGKRAPELAMDVRIKANLAFTVSGPSLEDAMAAYDELTVRTRERDPGQMIACDSIQVEVIDGRTRSKTTIPERVLSRRRLRGVT